MNQPYFPHLAQHIESWSEEIDLLHRQALCFSDCFRVLAGCPCR